MNMSQPLLPHIICLVLLASVTIGYGQPEPGPAGRIDTPALLEVRKITVQLMSQSGPGKVIVTFARDKAPAGPWRPDWPALTGPFEVTENPLEFSAPVDLTSKNIEEWDRSIEKAGLTWPDRFGNPVAIRVKDLIPPDKTFPWLMKLSVDERIIQQPLGYLIDPFKSLLIIDPAVVDNPARTWDPAPRTAATPHGTTPNPAGTPGGVWTFHHLVSCLANEAETGVSPSALVRQWLETWATAQRPGGPDGNLAPPRNHAGRQNLIQNWPVLGGSGGADAAPQLDTTKAPFRLLAIVNRFDLRTTSAFGSSSGRALAELRFVFGAVDTAGNNPGDARDFLVIFEFGVPLADYHEVHQYAREWAALSHPDLPPEDYLGKLESLTERIVRPVATSTRPNRSNLNQVRTSELLFGHDNWEFREFHIDAQSHHLKTATIAQTPDPWVNQESIGLHRWLQARTQDIKDGIYTLPEYMEVVDSLNGPVLSKRKLHGAMAQSGVSNTDWIAWGGGNYDRDARRAFIRNTCNGCHMNMNQATVNPCPDETPAFDFLAHIPNRSYSKASKISPFMHNPAGPRDDLRRRLELLRSAAESHPLLPLDEFFLRNTMQVH
jgi:hypothetical protein